jgi:hypothetical protein
LIQLAGVRTGDTVIEVGCGTGALLADLTHAVNPSLPSLRQRDSVSCGKALQPRPRCEQRVRNTSTFPRLKPPLV